MRFESAIPLRGGGGYESAAAVIDAIRNSREMSGTRTKPRWRVVDVSHVDPTADVWGLEQDGVRGTLMAKFGVISATFSVTI